MSTPLKHLVALDPVTPNMPGMTLRFHLAGDDDLAGGVGGWESLPRPRRRAAAEWVGTEPYTLALPLITTGVDARGPGRHAVVERKIRRLIRLAQRTRRTGEPPLLLVRGPVRLPNPRIRWVITGFDWGAQMRNPAGRRIQQEVVVHLMEHVGADILRGPAAKVRARRGL
jgi:hypothetical protein